YLADQADQRQNHEQYVDEHAGRGRQRAARREALLEPRVERIDDDAERHRPEDGLQETANEPEERYGDDEQERREERALHAVRRHSSPPFARPADRFMLSHHSMRSASVFSNPCRLGAYQDAPRSFSGRYS